MRLQTWLLLRCRFFHCLDKWIGGYFLMHVPYGSNILCSHKHTRAKHSIKYRFSSLGWYCSVLLLWFVRVYSLLFIIRVVAVGFWVTTYGWGGWDGLWYRQHGIQNIWSASICCCCLCVSNCTSSSLKMILYNSNRRSFGVLLCDLRYSIPRWVYIICCELGDGGRLRIVSLLLCLSVDFGSNSPLVLLGVLDIVHVIYGIY